MSEGLLGNLSSAWLINFRKTLWCLSCVGLITSQLVMLNIFHDSRDRT